MPFSSLGLCAEILRAVSEQGYFAPTPIQSKAIPPVLNGRDLLAAAQTGTGKTAGFTLPLLERLNAAVKDDRDGPGYCKPRALILTPTRELAAQVARNVVTYGKYLPLRSAVIFGGVNINPQINRLKRGTDIVVATPGRLLDHIQQETIDLSAIEILVLDEADRMLDMGFIPDIRRIMARLPTQRQTLLFSATFSDPIRKLAYGLLRDPALIEVAPRNATLDQIDQRAYRIAKGEKRALLAHLITAGDWPQILVFTRTKHGANRLAKQLSCDGINTAAIHGNKSQATRTQTLESFKRGRVRALIATDIAARGLDIAQLPLVVNFELPHVAQDYIHRIGRTGRAGSAGLAVSLICPEEQKLLAGIECVINRRLMIAKSPSFRPVKPTVPARRIKGEAPVSGPPTQAYGIRPEQHRRHSRDKRARGLRQPVL